MTHLFCITCNVTIDKCVCPDCDEKFRQIAYDADDPSVIMKWCRLCDKHFARCSCEVPSFFIICGGKEINPDELRDVFGRRPSIDLSPDSERDEV
jgi:hypothetical protein